VGLIREALEEHGVDGELIVAADGEQAIELIHAFGDRPENCPDLAIVDLSLPKRSGKEVLENLRVSGICRHMPVVVVSSSDVHQDKAEALRLGARQYIRKPTRLEEFLALGAIFKTTLASSRK
jgi:DNA-binding response OmpR family regulator